MATASTAKRCLALVAVVALLASCAAGPRPHPPSAVPDTPTARPVAPDPRVGALFLGGSDRHICTGAALASAGEDLILTAAHCLGAGVEADFVPGFDGGSSPPEAWRVDAVFLDPRWISGFDPMADYAVARVSRDDDDRLHSVTGGGLRVGAAPAAGDEITVLGYPAGAGGPTACRAAAAPARQGFPALHCAGVVDGFSGAPWISGSTVTGLVGGLDGGGCAEELSFSPPFDAAVAALVARAEAGGPGDEAPDQFDDGCD
ncbi:serine protease [Mycolicibacterium sp. jd]|uniref:trypsin-like serine peptidase n=1 Tax=Mycolicibacterium TaxID=1866885 RepID=UPI001CA33D75|nr:trypsin-like peptidase domain-containing protein [Mycolicibacterium austroafricanum]QZT59218.1 serine protease [Mycolicibacterium austroafricanum]